MLKVQGEKREFRRFQAKSGTGDIYTVIEWQHLPSTRSVSQSAAEATAHRRLTLLNGEPVSPRKEGGAYEIVLTGEVIREIA
jgi:hypothetical protein